MTTRDEKFWQRVAGRTASECWVWIGATRSTGYGSFYDGTRNVSAHRWAYERWVGAIPEGMVLDHLCRVRMCVNPAHLEVVTNRENVLRGTGVTSANSRKTHCVNGHEFSDTNTLIGASGHHRSCRACNAAKNRALRKRNRAAKGVQS